MENHFPEEVKSILNQFDLNVDQYCEIMKLLEKEMDKGLCPQSQSSSEVKMFPSYVTKLPSGKEEGQYLALDLGGTNYRVLLVTLKANETPIIYETTYNIPQEKMIGDGVHLFDFIAGTIADFLTRQTVLSWPLKLGFTFSFPCCQESLNKAILIKWTKGFHLSGCTGQNVAALLQTAVDKLKLSVVCVAVVNDTVGTLAACAIQDPHCAIGVIAGTGTNAAYVEEIAKVKTFKGSLDKVEHVVVNTEWGMFGENGSLGAFRTQYDLDLDRESTYPGQHIFEKMTSGVYLGELVRITLLDLIKKKYLFRGVTPTTLEKSGSFHTKFLYEVERDPEHLFYCTYYVLNEELNVQTINDVDAAIVRAVCEKVTTRAAYLIGTGISCLLNRIKKKEVTVGIDGSLYKFHEKFQERMTHMIEKLKGSDIHFMFKLSEDGSGRGVAAIVASISSS